MARVYISIGSNQNREYNVRSAVAALRAAFGPLTVSTVYQSQAVGFEGDDFFNLVVGFDSQEDVYRIAVLLREIETAHQRRRETSKFSSRTLDLDLLIYDNLVLNTGGIRLPRDDITRFAFVLRPLAEIAAERRHPLLGITFAKLWSEFNKATVRLQPVALAF